MIFYVIPKVWNFFPEISAKIFSWKLAYLQGGRIKISQILKQQCSAYSNARKTYNTAKEREFYSLSEGIFKNREKFFYKPYLAFFWQVAESAHAKLLISRLFEANKAPKVLY